MGPNEEGADCGGDAPADCPDICRPILIQGPEDESVNIIFVPNSGTYPGIRTMDQFRQDIVNIIENAYGASDTLAVRRDRFNFYYTTKMGTVTADSNNACNWNFPNRWREGCPNGSFGGLIHDLGCRDYSLFKKFSSEYYSLRTVVHESGHAIFHLSDQYDDSGSTPPCGTNYFQTDNFPNVFRNENQCEDKSMNPGLCSEFTTCGSNWWKSDQNGGIMDCLGNAVCPFRPDSTARVNWVLDATKAAGEAAAPLFLSAGLQPAADDEAQSVEVTLNVRDGEWSAGGAWLVPGEAPPVFDEGQAFRVRLFAADSSLLDEYGLYDPTLRYYDLGPTVVDNDVDFTLFLPYSEELALLNVYDFASDELLLSADIDALLGSTPLVAGWNDVCYKGSAQAIEGALADILDHVSAVYRLTPGQGFERWFPGKPELSTITTVNAYEPLIILMTMDRAWPQPVSGTPPTTASLVEGWNRVCYTGQTKSVEGATASISGQFGILYKLGSNQAWSRYVPGKPEVSDLSQLNQYDSVLILAAKQGGASWVFGP